MEKTPFVVGLILAIVALVAFNPGFRKIDPQDSCEISSYHYGQLHSAMNRYPEIADTARSEVTGDFVSISQYNQIMHKVDQIKMKQARQMAALSRHASSESEKPPL